MTSTATRTPFRLLFAALLALTVAGCVTTSGARGGRVTGRRVTAEDLQGVPWTDAWEVLKNHAWLQANSGGFILTNRGATSLSISGGGRFVLVVLDHAPISGNAQAVLKGVPTEDIELIRILRPNEAATRYGVEGSDGAVLVTTKR